MKEWFKYEFGYVNIDEKAVYLNNTGNWSDIPALGEKIHATKARDKKNVKSQWMLWAGGILFSLFIITKSLNIMLVGFFVLCFFAYQYLKSEIGISIKIPKEKINTILIEEDKVRFHFINGNGTVDKELLTKVDEKGIRLMEGLQYGEN